MEMRVVAGMGVTLAFLLTVVAMRLTGLAIRAVRYLGIMGS